MRLYAATGDGIARLDEAGEAWTVDLLLSGSGAQCLAVDPTDPDTVYAGLRESGVRRSTDGGRSWIDCRLPEPGVFSLDTRNGGLHSLGSLPVGVHDAAASVVGGRDVIFGGGTPSTVGSVEGFPAGRSGRLGSLPTPRSDGSAVTIGKTTYIIGGYTGKSPDAAVLATTNGRTYRSVASLPVPVRYPAVASVSGKLYVFGGEAITGRRSGSPINDIQEVDPTTHSSQVVAHMPEPLQGSAAVELGGNVYLVGGETSQRQPT